MKAVRPVASRLGPRSSTARRSKPLDKRNATAQAVEGNLGGFCVWAIAGLPQMTRPLVIVAYAIALVASGSARADGVLLSCWGTVELIQKGKQVNPTDERSSLAVAVDIAKKTVTINGVNWPIAGDASRETIVSMDLEKGSLTLNRITGAIDVHFIELDGLKKFYGECKPAQKLF
jgi:hypothetical protein